VVERSDLGSGLEISRVITGLWQIADMERDGRTLDVDRTAAAMGPYVQAGLTTFDMADHYGSAELIAGRFRSSAKNPAQMLTKWVPQPGPLTRDDVRKAVEQRLERLQSPTIDLLQFHAWSFAHPSWLDALFWLQELKSQGLIRRLGVTNFDTAHLRVAVASGIELASNQVCYSVIDRRPAQRMAAFCLEHGVKLLAYGTLAGGFLAERWMGKPEPDWQTWSQMKYGRFIHAAGGWQPFQQLLGTLDRIAGRHQVSLANVAARYVLEQPAVAGVIIGARLGQSEHIQDTLRLFEFALDQEDREAIAEAQERLFPLPGDSGDEYRRAPYLTASGDLSHHLKGFPPPFEVRSGEDGRQLASSGTRWEGFAGYSRAVRFLDRIWVSGTTATHGDRLIGGTDPAAQAHFVIDKIEGALNSLGARLENVVRTRIYVGNIGHWEAVARAHGERFAAIRPANTLVQAALVGKEYLVEIEAEAVL
jgi:aryl-alcohol dehydrogenase-like predicted oxidoreductase/enamine deaminase RidA (YjgF/YER057c/UK114 family)